MGAMGAVTATAPGGARQETYRSFRGLPAHPIQIACYKTFRNAHPSGFRQVPDVRDLLLDHASRTGFSQDFQGLGWRGETDRRLLLYGRSWGASDLHLLGFWGGVPEDVSFAPS